MSSSQQTTKRGRKSSISISTNDLNKTIVLKQYHFNYSESFATKLSEFAKAHLEDKSKEFKLAWKEWTKTNEEMVETEIERMKQDGYSGSVEEKMYFSARYYYRKKAMKEKDETIIPEPSSLPVRKKYELLDKTILVQMNQHVLSQMCKLQNITPSIAFADYCEKYKTENEDNRIKKTYKNLYWRISKHIKQGK